MFTTHEPLSQVHNPCGINTALLAFIKLLLPLLNNFPLYVAMCTEARPSIPSSTKELSQGLTKAEEKKEKNPVRVKEKPS